MPSLQYFAEIITKWSHFMSNDTKRRHLNGFQEDSHNVSITNSRETYWNMLSVVSPTFLFFLPRLICVLAEWTISIISYGHSWICKCDCYKRDGNMEKRVTDLSFYRENCSDECKLQKWSQDILKCSKHGEPVRLRSRSENIIYKKERKLFDICTWVLI